MKQGSSNSTWGKLICTFSLNNSDLKDIQVYPSYHKYVPPSFWQSNSYQIKSRATLPCKYPLTQNHSLCTHESLSNLSCVFIFSVFVTRTSATQHLGAIWTNFLWFFSCSWQNWRLPETAFGGQQRPYYLTQLRFETHSCVCIHKLFLCGLDRNRADKTECFYYIILVHTHCFVCIWLPHTFCTHKSVSNLSCVSE